MGDFLSNALGTNSSYQPSANQAGNQYGPGYLQQQEQNQADVYGRQQWLGDQLSKQMMGQGPNPAQTQYQQNVQNNIANAQGLIASQRGLNPALAARMGASAATSANNQAASQSALLQQQQQLGAAANFGNLTGQMQQGSLGYQGLYGQANDSNMNTNYQRDAANQQNASGIVGGIMGGIGSLLAHGGMVPGYADGGPVSMGSGFGPNMASTIVQNPVDYTNMTNPQAQPSSDVGKYLAGSAPQTGAAALQKGFSGLISGFGGGSKKGGAPALSMGSPMAMAGGDAGAGAASAAGDAASLGPIAALAYRGGKIPKNFQPGGRVPGKASVPGDSLKNDTVPAVVSPGEIVIPRSISTSKDAANKAAAFVTAVLAKKKRLAS